MWLNIFFNSYSKFLQTVPAHRNEKWVDRRLADLQSVAKNRIPIIALAAGRFDTIRDNCDSCKLAGGGHAGI
jgi:hypothetical protein